ncbi:hypothetical protein F4775DRAFT_605963 [Biscogniauxia sp. FL1348]|nr:hypothetical protein F4775DRAFT_605963 [Biscogniauxia sp. FL1348]
MSYLRNSAPILLRPPLLLLRTQRAPAISPLPIPIPPTTSRPTNRTIHSTTARGRPYKDDMDRESVKPKAHEYTQSGTDDAAATMTSDAAFDPSQTSPEAEKASAGAAAQRRGEVSPLEASPADRDFGGPGGGKKADESGPGSTAGQEKMKMQGKPKSSKHGSAPKKGKVV